MRRLFVAIVVLAFALNECNAQHTYDKKVYEFAISAYSYDPDEETEYYNNGPVFTIEGNDLTLVNDFGTFVYYIKSISADGRTIETSILGAYFMDEDGKGQSVWEFNADFTELTQYGYDFVEEYYKN